MVVGGRELIDTLWNVNDIDKYALDFMGEELIDTLWNVNKYRGKSSSIVDAELIDTLWNVNYTDLNMITPQTSRINRYIMECKFRCL